ncbi:MAG: NAD(P)-dependent oxidoreductase [Rhodospirillaceae bacterium]|nr:NAD(P)-dependent oxidoreductase [Rhodospirillaceae bacterium]
MKIVVTGSGGRIGRAIYRRLAPQHDVIGLDRAPSSTAHVLADICDDGALARAMKGADAVIHVAALHAPHVDVVSDADFARVNVEGTRRVLTAAVEAGVRRLVLTSTTALYGYASKSPDGAVWVDENTVPKPRNIYHRTKLEAEELLREAAQHHGLQVRIIRMSRCFPEPAPVMAAYRLHRGVDARDVAAAHALALINTGAPSQTYIVSGRTPFVPSDSPALLRDAPAVLAQRAPDLVRAFAARGWPLPRSIDRVYCAQRAERDLGWTPRFGFDEVLAEHDRESPEVLPPRP